MGTSIFIPIGLFFALALAATFAALLWGVFRLLSRGFRRLGLSGEYHSTGMLTVSGETCANPLCTQENPRGARFCRRCGEYLQRGTDVELGV